MSVVTIDQNPATLLQSLFAKKQWSAVIALTDSNTHVHCYPLIQSHLPQHHLLAIPAGEEFKTVDTCLKVWKQFTEWQLDRHALVLILGGGVAGDLGGFCAATYKRGIDFALMPTTLLAQVDASIGGKLGIDFEGYKNHIGVFCEPLATLISPAFLKTLPERELRSGFAEVIKHCLISDRAMWEVIRNKLLKEQDWITLIEHSVNFKKGVIEKDPREKGLRKILNFGHTVGHALESYFLNSEHRLFHGEAIAAGMLAEARIANRKQLLQSADLEGIAGFIKKNYPEVQLPPNADAIINRMRQDKKNKGNAILMALPGEIGQARWDVEVSPEEIEESLNYYQNVYT
jgi:3-dehydroquinate synthase